jgi:tetratricopeptide (TPR) repeat protein
MVFTMSEVYFLFKKGKILAGKGRCLEAIMLLEKAKNLEPKKGSIREFLASSYYNCGFYESARRNFMTAIEIDASNDFAHYGLGLCLIRENKLTRAAGHFKLAAIMNPSSKKYKEILNKIALLQQS